MSQSQLIRSVQNNLGNFLDVAAIPNQVKDKLNKEKCEFHIPKLRRERQEG
jgi:hypothetical protein